MDYHVAQGAGLGYKVDWDTMEKAVIHRLDSRKLL
jgi:hypothetical protein